MNKPMNKTGFKFLLGMCLLLTLVLAVLWVRSYFSSDVLMWRAGQNASVAIATTPGTFYVAFSGEPIPVQSRTIEYMTREASSAHEPSTFDVAGFGYYTNASATTAHVPLWFLLLLSAGTGSLVWWRGKHPRLGVCFHCGHKLPPTPGRCPECGTLAGST